MIKKRNMKDVLLFHIICAVLVHGLFKLHSSRFIPKTTMMLIENEIEIDVENCVVNYNLNYNLNWNWN